MWVTREVLYEQIWHEPATHLAKRYGISPVTLAKFCKVLGVPTPLRGHWVKLSLGKLSPRPLLPPLQLHQLQSANIAPPRHKAKQRPAAESTPGKERVSIRLTRPHPAVRTMMRALTRSPDGGRNLPIAIWGSPPLVQRALRIADALLKALQAKGYGFSPGSSDPINIGRSECSAILFGKFRVPFSIYEKYNHEKHTPTQFELENRDFIRPDKVDYRLSGILVFKIKLDSHSAPDYKKEWKDLPSRQLEDAIDEIVEGLIMAGTEFQNRCEEWARRAGELREQQDQQARAAHLEHLRKAGTADLEAQAHAWHRARVIRAFVAEVERLALASGGTLPTEIAQWLTWAKDQADRLDPLTHDIDAVIRGAKASA